MITDYVIIIAQSEEEGTMSYGREATSKLPSFRLGVR
jgi:hypothetical protein